MGFRRDLPLLDGYLMDLPDPGRVVLQDIDSRSHTWRALLDWYLTERTNADEYIGSGLGIAHRASHDGHRRFACRSWHRGRKATCSGTGYFAGSPKDYDRAYLS